MGLALCHVVPRDLLLRMVVVLLLVSFCLIAAAIGKRDEEGSLAKLTGSSSGQLMVDGRAISSAGVVCSESVSLVSCGDFSTKARTGSLLVIIGWCLTFVSLSAICFVTPFVKTTTKMFIAVWVLVLPPVALIVAGGAVLGGPALNRGLDAFPPGQQVTFGASARLVFATMALVLVSFVITSARLVIAVLLRTDLKTSHITNRNIAGVMSLHIVNDDWHRQKMMWALHAHAVNMEIVESRIGENGSIDTDSSDEENGHKVLPSVYTHVRRPSTMVAQHHAPEEQEQPQQQQKTQPTQKPTRQAAGVESEGVESDTPTSQKATRAKPQSEEEYNAAAVASAGPPTASPAVASSAEGTPAADAEAFSSSEHVGNNNNADNEDNAQSAE